MNMKNHFPYELLAGETSRSSLRTDSDLTSDQLFSGDVLSVSSQPLRLRRLPDVRQEFRLLQSNHLPASQPAISSRVTIGLWCQDFSQSRSGKKIEAQRKTFF